MVFDARELAAGLPSAPFEWIGMDGETYQLPNAAVVTGAQADRLMAGDLTIIKDLASGDVYEAVMDLPVRLQVQFADAWVKHSRSPGKGASPSSPRRTSGTRLKST